ncbi:DNA polymerase III subunit gamma/tau [Seleniivibrio woodruffii]|uniref:DNA polymerase III subunit gamma/tau n=1 Tax=Seleniivibrio woodruffii TaxID=1078050 RepID=UPI002409A488|nr:DNA polymerase III subunit gamma/tau [Seleniivibrio woodruffii]
MSYIALARKLRPQNFDELSGQGFVVTTLKNSIEMGRIVHAYLFTGPRGVGKTSAARILAKAVNCLDPDGCNPCNKCENCLEITSGTSMDVAEIDGASNRGIDEIRDLREAVRFLPMKCKYKVYIIDEVHMLTEHAFNALLKTLEEPPEYVIFILATTDPHRIPATIISRCQKYDFNKIPFDIMYKSLANALDSEGITYEPDALSLVVRNSDGCMRDSLSLLDQIIAFTGGSLDEQNTSFLLGYSDKSIMNRLFEAVIKENTQDIPQICAELTAKGINHTFAAETLIEHTRNLMLRIITKKDNPELTSKENEFYASLAQASSEQRLFALFQVFQKLLNDIKFFSFSQYVFEFGMYKAASLSGLISTAGMVPAGSAKAPSVPLQSAAASAPTMIQKPQAEVSAKPTLNSTDIQLQNIMNALEEQKQPLVASNLSHGYIIQLAGGVLSIGFSTDKKFHYDYIVRKQNIDLLNTIIPQAFPNIKEVAVTLEQDSKKKSIIEKKERIETFHDMQIKKEAEQDSIVKLLLNEFDGKLRDIDVLARPSFDSEDEEPDPDDI